MPEGPSIVIIKEHLAEFKGQKVLEAFGNASIDKESLVNKIVVDLKSWGKHFLICFEGKTLRVHFLMFGSYSINEQTKTDKSLRLCLRFANGSIYFYTCAIKELEAEPADLYDWSADVLSDYWNAAKAIKKLKNMPDEMACDVLLDQDVFAGVGNIIKNEVLYRIKIHPESIVSKIPVRQLKLMANEARIYSFQFLEWKKLFELRKHWLAYSKKICTRCNLPFVKQQTGRRVRRSFFCSNCQVLYK